MNHFFPTTAAALGVLLVSMSSLAAQSNQTWRVTAGFGHRADAEIDHRGGDFNETRFGLSATHEIKINERWRLDPFLGYRFSSYDFSRANLWDDVHAARVTVLAQYALNEKWTLFGGPTVGFAAEDDADFGKAFTFGGAVGAIYKINERLALGAGVGVTSELEDNARVRPAIIVKWRINEHWSAESGYFEVAGSGGPGAEIRYHLNEKWTLAGGGQYHETRFRLDENGPVRDGVGEDTSLPVYVKAVWQAGQNVGIEAGVGVSLGGQLRVEDRRGHKISDEDYDPAPFAGVRAVFTF